MKITFAILFTSALFSQAGCLDKTSADAESDVSAKVQGITTTVAYDLRCDFCRPAQANDPPTIAAAVAAAKARNVAAGTQINVVKVSPHPGSSTTTTRTLRVISTPVSSGANFVDEGFEQDGEQTWVPPSNAGNTFVVNLEGDYPTVPGYGPYPL